MEFQKHVRNKPLIITEIIIMLAIILKFWSVFIPRVLFE